MSHTIIMDGVRSIIIEKEPKGKCELCGKIAELRPYGPNGENICVECGMKDKNTTLRRMAQRLFGEKLDA